MSAPQWFCYDPCDGYETFATEADAVAHAEHCIELALDDGVWDESASGIVVGYVTHYVEQTVVAVRSEMSAEEWNDRFCRSDVDEIWDFTLKPAAAGVSLADENPE